MADDPTETPSKNDEPQSGDEIKEFRERLRTAEKDIVRVQTNAKAIIVAAGILGLSTLFSLGSFLKLQADYREFEEQVENSSEFFIGIRQAHQDTLMIFAENHLDSLNSRLLALEQKPVIGFAFQVFDGRTPGSLCPSDYQMVDIARFRDVDLSIGSTLRFCVTNWPAK